MAAATKIRHRLPGSRIETTAPGRRAPLSYEQKLAELAQLFREAGHAHHLAFLATNGDDPEWPRWYAEFLRPRLATVLDAGVSVEELAKILEQLEADRKRTAPTADWPQFYAAYFLSQSGAKRS
jgi:hypothetical protein